MNEAVTLTLLVYGLAIVISLAVALLVKLLVAVMHAAPRQAQPTAAPVPTANGIPPAHVVAISAALADLLAGHRIVHISQRPQVEGWAQEGRLAHHHSHNIPRHGRR